MIRTMAIGLLILVLAVVFLQFYKVVKIETSDCSAPPLGAKVYVCPQTVSYEIKRI